MIALFCQLVDMVKLNLNWHIGESNFLGYRVKDEQGKAGPYEWLTFSQVKERVDNFASGLANMQIPEKASIGIFSINRVEWVNTSKKG